MTKEKNYNPVQAQRKADKAKTIKKGKAEVQARRNQRLARRNPDGIRRQIDDLKAVAANGGQLSSHEQSVLEGLEKELKAVEKAREALGDRAPEFRSGGGGGALGKRRRGDDETVARRGRESDSDEEEVPEEVRRIPMPRDTPPPIPKEVLDKWWERRRAKRGGGVGGGERGGGGRGGGGEGSSANAVPLANDRGLGGRGDRAGVDGKGPGLPTRPPAAASEARVVYESKPMVRDLRKEAVSAFMPAAVAAKMALGKGQGGGLMEPEVADRLEREGYLKTEGGTGTAAERPGRQVMVEEVEDEEG